MAKTKIQIKNEIVINKNSIEKPKFTNGSLKELQDAIIDIYNKLNDINERI